LDENPSIHTKDIAETTSQTDGRTHGWLDGRTHTDKQHENITSPALPTGGGGIKKPNYQLLLLHRNVTIVD